MLQSYAITLVLQGTLIALFGWKMVLFLAIHNLVAWWQLTSANYVEHYGLLRLKGPDGQYERCQPHHSWNANHTYTNLVLFQLERHSDHHANAARRYQSLRHFPDLPQLPSGYFGMFPLAYVPSLWFKVMDPRLLALPHIRSSRWAVVVASASARWARPASRQAAEAGQRAQAVVGRLRVAAAATAARAGEGCLAGAWAPRARPAALGPPEGAVERGVVRHQRAARGEAQHLVHHARGRRRVGQHGVADAGELLDEGRHPGAAVHQALVVPDDAAALDQHRGDLGGARALAGGAAGGFEVDDGDGGR
jgi:hypothetical protein